MSGIRMASARNEVLCLAEVGFGFLEDPMGFRAYLRVPCVGQVGGSGSYDRVVDMAPGAWPPPCSDANACVKASKPVSGPLVPFDEEMTMVFSGPIELYDIAVYAPALRPTRSPPRP